MLSSNNLMTLISYWDRRLREDGHTGYDDRIIYKYDQPLRVKSMKRILRRIFPFGLRGKTTLDIGCGTGDFVSLLLEEDTDKVCAADISPEVVKFAKTRFQDYRSRVSIETGAIQELKFSLESFDLITSVTVFQHIVNDEELTTLAQKLAKSLTPNGYLVFLEISPFRKLRSDNSSTLKERTLDEWMAIFSNTGLLFACKPFGYAPLGFCILQLWLPYLIQKCTGKKHLQPGNIANNIKVSFSLRDSLKRKLYHLLRTAILFFTYPVDYVLNFTLPARFAYYHFFILKKDVSNPNKI